MPQEPGGPFIEINYEDEVPGEKKEKPVTDISHQDKEDKNKTERIFEDSALFMKSFNHYKQAVYDAIRVCKDYLEEFKKMGNQEAVEFFEDELRVSTERMRTFENISGGSPSKIKEIHEAAEQIEKYSQKLKDTVEKW